MKVLDLYGNRAREGYLNIAEAPYYVLSDGFSDREFTEKLKNLKFRFTDPLSAAPATRNVAGKYLLATIRNDSSEQYEAIIGFQGRRITAAENINAVIPAERTINVQIPIRSKRGDSESTLQIYARNMMTAFPVTVRDNIAIPAGKQVVLSDGDFRASWVIRKTDGKIIFEATVRDSTNSGSNAAGRELVGTRFRGVDFRCGAGFPFSTFLSLYAGDVPCISSAQIQRQEADGGLVSPPESPFPLRRHYIFVHCCGGWISSQSYIAGGKIRNNAWFRCEIQRCASGEKISSEAPLDQ